MKKRLTTTKRESIARVNAALGQVLLKNDNTSFSNVNAAKPVWWFNIDPCKFEKDLHLLLCAKNGELIWLKIDANTFRNPAQSLGFRPDKGLVDLKIPCDGERYMHDVRSGGSGYDFRPHIQSWNDNMDNPVLEHLKGIQAKIGDLSTDVQEMKMRLSEVARDLSVVVSSLSDKHRSKVD